MFIKTNNPLYKAIIKSLTGRFTVFLIQFFLLTIYARIFTPKEFGVIASIQVFVIFFQMLADVGIGPAIINEDKFTVKQRDGIFTVTAMMGILLAIFFFLFSYVINDFYNGYKYQEIAVLVCITIFFSSLSIIPATAMNKDAKFLSLASADISSELLSFLCVYIVYSNGVNGVLALALRPAIQSLVRFLVVFLLSKNTSLGRPFFGSEIYHIKTILSFSAYQFGFNFINYFSRNLDNILVGKYFGMATLGIYEKSYQLMRYPLLVTTFAMTPAIQPVLTKVRGDRVKIVNEHNLLTSKLLAISLPISFFIFFNENSIILLLFGDKWLSVGPLIKVFSFMIPIQAVLSTSGSFFQVMNMPRLLFISGLFSAFISVTAIILGVFLGDVIYVAYMLVIAFILNFIQIYYILFKYCFVFTAKFFYLRLFKVLACMSIPIFFYITIKQLILVNYEMLPFSNLLVNIIAGIIVVSPFYSLIKKITT